METQKLKSKPALKGNEMNREKKWESARSVEYGM